MKATGRALIGLAIAAGAPIAYFEWWAKDVRLGELTWPCWLVIAIGLLIAGSAAVRPPPAARRADRVVAGLCFALAVGVAGVFGWYLASLSGTLPEPIWSELVLGRRLPSVTLVASDGREFNLQQESRGGSLQGRKVLLSFFRGHW